MKWGYGRHKPAMQGTSLFSSLNASLQCLRMRIGSCYDT